MIVIVFECYEFVWAKCCPNLFSCQAFDVVDASLICGLLNSEYLSWSSFFRTIYRLTCSALETVLSNSLSRLKWMIKWYAFYIVFFAWKFRGCSIGKLYKLQEFCVSWCFNLVVFLSKLALNSGKKQSTSINARFNTLPIIKAVRGTFRSELKWVYCISDHTFSS